MRNLRRDSGANGEKKIVKIPRNSDRQNRERVVGPSIGNLTYERKEEHVENQDPVSNNIALQLMRTVT